MITEFTRLTDCFNLLSSFELPVPKDYVHGTQLAAFAEFAENETEKFRYCDSKITDENFAKATNRLVPGKKYEVKIFGIRQNIIVESEDCLKFLRMQKAILMGAQGVSLARQLKKDEFPAEKFMVSFDEKEALWKDADGYVMVPCMYWGADERWGFGLGGVSSGWDIETCLLCFCEPND